SKKIWFLFQNCQSFYVYSAKNKKCRGDQIPPNECSICGGKIIIWVQCCTTAQLSVKLPQCRIEKNGLVREGGKSSRAEVVKDLFTTIVCAYTIEHFNIHNTYSNMHVICIFICLFMSE
ncbi:hypothetical protein AB205_0139430, partial [Aquarana catesbeiana]